jgi:hypothetical protein
MTAYISLHPAEFGTVLGQTRLVYSSDFQVENGENTTYKKI